MEIIPLLLKELEQEVAITHKMLAIVPDDQWDWKPHPKSMNMHSLTTHLADISGWPASILATSELDFVATPYTPAPASSAADLLKTLQQSVEKSRTALQQATDADLLPTWTLRAGDHIITIFTRYEAIRHAFAQMIHHRAQLGVFLRLLNIPIPGSYGPSADEMGG